VAKKNMLFLSPSAVVALQKIIQAATGFVTAVLVATFLSPMEQGYFYTIGSLISTYILFDLGLSVFILQLSAEKWSGLRYDEEGRIIPNGSQRVEFLIFFSWVSHTYSYIRWIFICLMLPVGIFILSQTDTDTSEINGIAPWVSIIAVCAFAMPLHAKLNVIEGTGSINFVYRFRILYYLLGGVISYSFILLGLGLYSPAGPFLAALITSLFYHRYFSKFNINENCESHYKKIAGHVRPQIKFTFIILLSNYLFINFPIIALYINGKVVTSGQIGLSFVVANVVGSVCTATITSVTPKTIQLISNNRLFEANILFLRSLKKSMIVISLVIPVICLSITYLDSKYLLRLSSIFDLFFILIGFFLFHINNSCLIYFRALKRNYAVLCHAVTIFLILPLFLVIAILFDFPGSVFWALSLLPLTFYFLKEVYSLSEPKSV
jgi:acyl-coenzyme A thioesterase PaaI-like protein